MDDVTELMATVDIVRSLHKVGFACDDVLCIASSMHQVFYLNVFR